MELNFYFQCISTSYNIPTDLEIELLRAKKYWEWKNQGLPPEYQTQIKIFTGTIFNKNIIPVGTIEFVQAYCKYDIPKEKLYPISIPSLELPEKYLGREFVVLKPDHSFKLEKGEWMLKDAVVLKSCRNGFVTLDKDYDNLMFLPDNEFIASRKIPDVKCEFRIFIGRRAEILDVKNYVGWEIWPDVDVVSELAKLIYDRLGRPFTFDVMVTSTGETYLLEVHDWWAVGLYGFSCPESIIYCIKDWWRYITSDL